MMLNGRKYPFTASQFQELKQQTLIFKYMYVGLPIPSELILNMKNNHTSPSSAVGWSCCQHNSRIDDPEPGRCRRTDGKKWRCSKGVYPGSKYCEKHIHRGKNRSRKSVEAMSLATTTSSNQHQHTPHLSISQPEANHQIMYPYPQNTSIHFNPETSNDHKDYRYGDVSEYAFLSPRGIEGGSPFEFKPLGISSLKEEDDKEQHQHCFVMGADLRLEKSVKEEKVDEEEAMAQRQPLRLFFDEWPQKATQLSLSTPIAYQCL